MDEKQEVNWSPPYIYQGLAESEELLARQEHQAQVYREIEKEKHWRHLCETGGMHRYGFCGYCGKFYD